MGSESSDADLVHLRAAQGWLELGNEQEADAELGKVTLGTPWKEDGLTTLCLLLSHRKNWLPCLFFSKCLVEEFPASIAGYAYRSRSLDGMNKTQEAVLHLVAALAIFPEHPGIAYDLAQYFHRLGHMKAARYWLGQCLKCARKAKDLDYYKRLIADDEALQPLFEDIPDQEAINSVSLN